ncbi:DMT family transporter [Rubinisphaera margarita]|uniref:DMT family transporter n=1 Tax=Rubinisphaera margarita TaxID=2909586 RepID=UPI001EE9120E|nr:DMT family transporter [Rubinisphaera margarita]MCG6154994.1 DMT family transporter [Rubinisphaera margarita]
MTDFPFHLLLPLTASLLFVAGLIFVKRTTVAGINPWTVAFLSNQFAALFFTCFWFVGGTMQPLSMLWQPAIVAALYTMGLSFTFLAIERGDVSVATPVFGVKVLFVAVLVTFLTASQLSLTMWLAAALAVLGIAMIQWTSPGGNRRKLLLAIGFALCAAMSFAHFDVLVQKWAPQWGIGRFLPIVYWMVALMSVVFLRHFQPHALKDAAVRPALLIGSALIGMQAIFIVSTLSIFGDATRVNIVYATRGLWGVLFAWASAKIWGGAEATVPVHLMLVRVAGAVVLTTAVILALAMG